MKLTLSQKNKLILVCIKIIKILLIIALCFIILLPIYKMFIDTINYGDPTEFYYLVPIKISFNSYRRIVKRYFVDRLLANTLMFALGCAIIQTIVCALSGYAFAHLKFKGYRVVFVILMIPLFLIKEGMYVQYQALYNDYPLFGIEFFHNKWSVFIMYIFGAGIKTPIFIYLFKIVFEKMNFELLEQARVDGCGVVRTFTRIAFPLAKEAIVPCLFFTFIWEYNDYYYPQYFGFAYDDFPVISLEVASGRMPGSANTNAFSMLVPALIIYLIIERTLFASISKDREY